MGSYSKRCRAWFAQRFTHDPHAVGMRDPAEVRSQVRAAGTHSGADAGPVRTGGSHYWFATPMREPEQPACYQKLWFPGLGFQWGFHGVAALPVVTAQTRPARMTTSKPQCPPPSASRSDLRFSQVTVRRSGQRAQEVRTPGSPPWREPWLWVIGRLARTFLS